MEISEAHRGDSRSPIVVEIAVHFLIVGLFLSATLRDAAAVGLFAALLYDRRSRSSWKAWPWDFAIGAFVAVHVASALASNDPVASLERLRFYPIGLLLFFGSRVVVADGGVGRLAKLLGAVAAVYSADVLWQASTGTSWIRGSGPVWGRFPGALPYPSDASLLPLLLPLISLAVPAVKRPVSIVAVAGLGLCLLSAAVALSGTRSAWAALLLATLVLPWIHGRTALALRSTAAVFGVSVVVGFLSGGLGATERLLSAERYRSEQRLLQWQAAWALFVESPILGNGPHSFRTEVAARASDGDALFAAVDPDYAPYPHNLYLESLAGTGIAGLGSFLGLLVLPGWALLQNRRSRVCRAAFASTLLFAAIGFLDMSLVKDWVQLCFWLPLGAAAGDGTDPPALVGGSVEPTSV